jgi:hypothetical protein
LVAIAAVGVSAVAAGQTVPNQSLQRGRIGTGLGQTQLPKGGTFEPRVETAVQYVSNMTLAPDGEPQIDMAGLELSPGFYASYSSGSAIAAIDYSLVGRSWEDSDFNDVSHRLSANGQWYAVPDWFSLQGQASYSDGVIDPRAGLNYGGLGIFGPSNLQEMAAASVSPVLQHRFNQVEFLAQYTYGRTWYLDEGKGQDVPVFGFVTDQDSTDQSANLSVGTADTGGPLNATAFYTWQKSEFDTALPYEYEQLGLDLGYQVSRTVTLLGLIGVESDLDESTTQGGLDSSYWNVGARWDPNDRTSAEARYGERFFGSTWLLAVSHRARLLEFDASYSEEPTVETRTLSLGQFNPGELPPGAPDVDFGRFNSSPFVARNASAGIRAVGSLTTLGLRAYQYERDYLRAFRQDETQTGIAFDATRRLASNLSADFTVSYSLWEYGTDSSSTVNRNSDYNDLQTTLRLNRQSGKHLTLSAEAGYLVRTNDLNDTLVPYAEYDGWWTGLRARWVP